MNIICSQSESKRRRTHDAAEFNSAQNVRDPSSDDVYHIISQNTLCIHSECELISISDVIRVCCHHRHRIVSDRKDQHWPTRLYYTAAAMRVGIGWAVGWWEGVLLYYRLGRVGHNEFGQNLSRRVRLRSAGRRRRRRRRHIFMLFDGDKCTYVIGSDGFVRVPPSRLSTSLRRFSYYIYIPSLSDPSPPQVILYDPAAIFGR